MTDHRFLNADRSVESTRFGDDVRITVNFGPAKVTVDGSELPRYGFLVDSPTLVAFHARSYRGQRFTRPTMLVAHSADGRPLKDSSKVVLEVLFGDAPGTWEGRPVSPRRGNSQSFIESPNSKIHKLVDDKSVFLSSPFIAF